jgi:hypothetical protein
MKKTITLALSTSFLLGFAAAAMAGHETIATDQSKVVAKDGVRVTMDGNFRTRGRIFNNVTGVDTMSHYDGRVQLGTKVETSSKISGYVQLETGDGTSDVYTWGNGNSAGLNGGGSKQATATDATDLSIVQAWVNYKFGIFGTKVGHVPLALGNKTFFDHSPSGDDTVIFYADPSADTHVGLLTVKFEEGTTAENRDDLDGYVALVTQKMGDMKLGANLTYLHAGSQNTAPGLPRLALYNLGADFAGKFGPASVNVDAQYQFGDVTKTTAGTATKAKGYCLRAEATMAAGPATVGAIIGYGSGDGNAGDNDAENFINFLADVKYETLIVGYAISPAGKANNDRLANMLLVQVNGAAKINDDISVNATLTYMDLNEAPNYTGTAIQKESDIGIEIDAFLNWKLGNGLSYGIEAGFLFAGDAWKTSQTADVSDSYYLRHTLNLSF